MVAWNIALKNAIIARVRASAEISALVGQRIYDEAPRAARGDAADVQSPYLYLGEMIWRRIPSSCAPSFSVTFRLNIVVAEFGRDKARELQNLLFNEFDQTFETLADGHAMNGYSVIAGGDGVASDMLKEAYIDVQTDVSAA